MHNKTWLAAAAIVVAGYAFAADGQNGVERQSALDTSSYTAIPRVVFNSNGATSYLRFGNASGASASFEVKVTGGETGTAYTESKAYQLTVPDKGSVQKSIDDIRAGIAAQGGPDIALKSGDTFLNLYVTSDRKGSGAAFQHVTFNGDTGFFENVSLCTYDPTKDYSGATSRVVNVHTSRINGYPSKVEIHNPDAASRTVRGKVYDAVSGTSLGSFTVNVPANATTVMDESAIEQQIAFTPSASQQHINIEFETADSGAYTAVVAHKVTQVSSGAVFNLSQVCAINPARTSPSNCTTTGGMAAVNPSGDTGGGNTGGTNTGCCPSTPVATNPSGSGSSGSAACGNSDTFAAVGDTLTQAFTVGQPTTIALGTLLNNDTKAAGATLESATAFVDAGTGAPNGTFTTTTAPVGYTTSSGAGATYAGGIIYTPARPGAVTFTYRLTSSTGAISNYATVTLTVGGTAAAAITANDDMLTQTFQVGQSVSITLASLTANDTNVTNATTIESVTPFVDSTGTENGTYTQLPTIISYVPSRAGTVTFTYRLSPGGGGAPSNFATVTLTVADPNLPRPADDTLNQGFAVGVPATIQFSTLTVNDFNASGATVESLTPFVSQGTVAANGTYSAAGSTISYTPARAGPVTFTYRLRNGSGLSYPATVTLTVGAEVTKAPTTADDTISYTIPAGTLSLVQINLADVIGNDSDTAGATFDQSVSLALTATNGTVGNFSVIPLVDRILIDNLPASSNTLTFNYRLKNSIGTSNTSKITVNVTKLQ